VSAGPVLYVLERYPELSQTFVAGEIDELRSRGVAVEVLALAPGTPQPGDGAAPAAYPADRGPAGRLAALGALAWRRPRACARLVTREPFWPPDGRRARALARIAPFVGRAGAARHLHAHFADVAADLARVLSLLSGTRFSFSAHATDVFREPEAIRANLAGAAFCVTNCEYNRRHLAAVAPEHCGKVTVIGMGADLRRFGRRRPYDPDGPIVAVGRLVPKKAFDKLVRAAAAIRDRTVLIAGEGPEREALERLVAQTGAPVRLLGALAHGEVRDLVESAALFALPCVVAPDGDRDGTPVAILEAMALEVPVVATEEVGIPELVGADRGRLVPPGDSDALAAAVREVLAMRSADRVAMGRAGRAWVERNADRSRQAELLRRLIEGPRDGAT
jgi:glycosyltransferase involved in cell wall biosynthesis